MAKKYNSFLENFDGYNWIIFYQGENKKAYVKTCTENFFKVKRLEEFEKETEERFLYNKNNEIYKTYTEEINKLKSALGLPIADKDTKTTKINNFNKLLEKNLKNIKFFIKYEIENCTFNIQTGNNYSKKILWLLEATKRYNENIFEYLHEENSKYYCYDFIILKYLDNNFAIAVPVLAEILEVSEKNIYDSFPTHKNKNEINFI